MTYNGEDNFSDGHLGKDLGAYHDGELSADRRAEVEAHLRFCAECRAALAQLGRLSLAFASSDRVELSAMARRRIEQAMAIPGWVRLVLPVARPFAAAAAILLAIGLPVLVMSSSSQSAEAAPATWETAVIAPDATGTDAASASQVQFADWVVADLSSSRRR